MSRLMKLDAQALRPANTVRNEDHVGFIVDRVRAWQKRFGGERMRIFAIAKAVEIPWVQYSFFTSGRRQPAQCSSTGHDRAPFRAKGRLLLWLKPILRLFPTVCRFIGGGSDAGERRLFHLSSSVCRN